MANAKTTTEAEKKERWVQLGHLDGKPLFPFGTFAALSFHEPHVSGLHRTISVHTAEGSTNDDGEWEFDKPKNIATIFLDDREQLERVIDFLQDTLNNLDN